MIERLRTLGTRLRSPDYVMEELTARDERIRRVANISPTEFAFLLSLLDRTVSTVEAERYLDRLTEAERLAPHPKDAPYFALALEIGAPIWSDETAFTAQDEVRIYTTSHLYAGLD